MITAYTIHQYDEVMALPEPKHVWIDGVRIVVYTGEDIPPPPPAMEATYTESEVVALLKSAGKTDAEAKAMVKV